MKYLILDYNGTVTDDAQIGWRVANKLFKYYEAEEISFERFQETFEVPWRRFFLKNGVREERIDVPAHQRIFRSEWRKEMREEFRLRKGVKETLEKLKGKGVRIGLLTLRNKEDVRRELGLLGIARLFDVIDAESSLERDGSSRMKDARSMMKRLEITHPGEAALVGDMLVDIRTANRYGFTSVALTGGWQSKERLEAAKPDFLIDEIPELLSL